MQGSVTLEEIHTVEDFVDKLERIDPPSQLVAGLRDPLLQKYLSLHPSAETQQRLEFWLLRYFEEELDTLREGFGASLTLTDMLAALVEYTEATKVSLPWKSSRLLHLMPTRKFCPLRYSF